MLTKRLIFTLLYDNGSFVLSRNFRLQKIGDISWLEENYGFASVGYSIDELVVIDVSRGARDTPKFCENLKLLTKDCFAPIAAGGGIRTLNHARDLLRSGADKIVINSALHDQPELVDDLATEFGRQCIIASVDSQKIDNSYRVFKHNGTIEIGQSLEQFLLKCAGLPIGEIYLTSIERDGTGNGLDLEMLDSTKHINELPLILMGGVGRADHIVAGLKDSRLDAVATANLLNFMGNGLSQARDSAIANGVNLPLF
ncbi:MAG: imidazole glycerol phosphate synthase subunit HisF [Actinobacteria bacterium]|nr:imidazole glycerol phosphate synthase subunit HisF [Actinomycetota bacterium]NBO97432.1 imidazole glycerol phosphate synthase subunit HisF [Actinomycetota bacterium]NBP41832.1 imidazole glycerol phosphate synthase subunit HisF [Actinomycetota bacterium]NBQ04817.1 imidazole glycerol phosphate synthase subunit HisF [Actinomycetota bacterium]NBQ45428.1 imidazole glycerol phosphate synthase subunit HisF [Actinomycetota bacterium]